MAESTNPTPTSSSSAPAKKSTQYIAPAVDDDRLEPDALRGSDFLTHQVKEAGVEDLDAARVAKLKEAEKKAG